MKNKTATECWTISRSELDMFIVYYTVYYIHKRITITFQELSSDQVIMLMITSMIESIICYNISFRRVNLRLNPKKIDTKGFLMDSGRICHVN